MLAKLMRMPSSVAALNPVCRGGSLSDVIPYLSIMSDGLLVMKSGALARICRVSGTPYNTLDMDSINQVGLNLATALNQMPLEISKLQFHALTGSDYGPWLDGYGAEGAKHPVVRALLQERLHLYRTALDNRDLRRIHVYMVIIHDPPVAPQNSGILDVFKSKPADGAAAVLAEHYRTMREQLAASLRTFSQTMAHSGFQLQELPGVAVSQLLYRIHNPVKSQQWPECMYPVPPGRTLEQTIIHSPVSVEADRLEYDGCMHKVISMYEPPLSTTQESIMSLFRGEYNDWRICVTLLRADKPTEIKRLQNMQKRSKSMIALSEFQNQDARVQYQNLDNLLMQLAQSDENLFRVRMMVHIWDREKSGLAEKEHAFASAFRFMDQATGFWEEKGTFFSWQQTLPGNVATKFLRPGVLLPSLNTAHMCPLFLTFEGEGKPKMLFENTNHGLGGFDLFSSSVNAWNTIVIGGTGGGKSFLVNSLLYQAMARNPRIIIVDIGGSYKKLTEILNGQYVDVNLNDSSMCFNPFQLYYGSDDKGVLAGCKYMLERMCLEIDQKHCSNSEMEDFEISLMEAKENCRRKGAGMVTVSDVHVVLQGRNPALAKRLATWTRGREKGNFVDGRSTITFNRDVICFELKGLDRHPDLQALMLMIIINFVWEVVALPADRDREKILVLDESWKLLTMHENAKVFLAETFRTLRKYRAAVIGISQVLDDLTGAGLADAVLNNCYTYLIMKQSPKALESCKTTLNLNDNQGACIRNLRKEDGKYSDFFFYRQLADGRMVSGVLRNSITPAEYWLFTSSRRDNVYFYDQLAKNNGNYLETVRACAAAYPTGKQD